jgi:hypothetical protein
MNTRRRSIVLSSLEEGVLKQWSRARSLALRLVIRARIITMSERMARALIARYPAVQRLRPPLHDWNDSLRPPV